MSFVGRKSVNKSLHSLINTHISPLSHVAKQQALFPLNHSHHMQRLGLGKSQVSKHQPIPSSLSWAGLSIYHPTLFSPSHALLHKPHSNNNTSVSILSTLSRVLFINQQHQQGPKPFHMPPHCPACMHQLRSWFLSSHSRALFCRFSSISYNSHKQPNLHASKTKSIHCPLSAPNHYKYHPQ
jgi:hypothetical protein